MEHQTHKIKSVRIFLDCEVDTDTHTFEQSYTRQAIKRYLIVDVADGHYDDANGRSRPEKVSYNYTDR